MFNKKILALIKREVREKLMSKTFVYTTIALPLLMIFIISLQTALFTMGSGSKHLIIASDTENLTSTLEYVLLSNESLKASDFTFDFLTLSEENLDAFVKENKTPLLQGKITGIVFVPSEALKNKKIKYFSKTPKDFTLTKKLGAVINAALVEQYFKGKNISQEDLDFARRDIKIIGFKVSKKKAISEAGYGNLILAYLFTFLLYISLLMMGQMTMQSVMEEKSNRIVEVILSSVNSRELMTGKILGSSIIGLAQLAIWLSPVALVVSTSWFALPKEFAFEIEPWQFAYMLINFFLGLLTFIGLYATMGAIFDNPQDAQSGMWPVTLLIIIPFFIAMALMENPNSTIGNIGALAPFTSIIVMPAKMTLSDVPLWQILLSLLVDVLTILIIFPIAGKIYQVGILRTGKKPKWGEVIKWLRYKY